MAAREGGDEVSVSDVILSLPCSDVYCVVLCDVYRVQWEKHLLDKQQHYAAELANRDLLIQEMHVVSRENAQLVQDLEKRHEEVLRQYHRQCEEVQTQQRQLRDSVQHLLATASQHQLSEKQQLTRALQHYLSTTSQKWSEKEKEWRQRCQQLE